MTFTAFSRFSMIVALAACASSGGSGTSRASPDRITRSEITASSAINAWELINRLRPNWLRVQATGSIGSGARSQAILVYLDGQRLQDVSALRTIGVEGLTSIEWYDATRAPTVLPNVPSGPIAGAIVIKTR